MDEQALAQNAVALALKGNWKDAVDANLEILSKNNSDVDALNRLSRAYSELDQIPLAKKTAHKVLTIDPLNSIALKCLEKWKGLNKNSKSAGATNISPESFLEESGKTKHVSLINTGSPKLLSNLDPGVEVKLSCFPHKVSVNTQDDKYLGRLPDDLAARLKNLIKSGYKYQVLIKSVGSKDVAVFIREIERGEKSSGAASFPTEKIEYVSFTPPELIHKESVVTTDEQQED